MADFQLDITYIGGPTALLEIGGLRFLTDPTFDQAGAEFRSGAYILHKTSGPAVSPMALGPLNAVLLSHDHHFDNLDEAGRAFLQTVPTVLTTLDGATRLGGNAVGLAPWQTVDLSAPDGRILHVTGSPARHGPADGDRGPVTGFALTFDDTPDETVYLSGDTVWYEGIAEVARRFQVRVAVLFMGAARVAAVGPAHLTLTADEGVKTARVFPNAAIVPLHYEGWAHFSESRPEIEKAFTDAGMADRLRWLEPGRPMAIEGGVNHDNPSGRQ